MASIVPLSAYTHSVRLGDVEIAQDAHGRFHINNLHRASGAAGLQRKNQRGEWELTEAGAKYGEMVPYSNNGHAGYQPLWKPSVVEVLRNPADQVPAAGEVA
jgi:hypothetical protein